MTLVSRLAEIKHRAEQAREEAAKAKGALEQSMKRLKAEFGCGTLEAAEEKLTQLERKEATARAQFEKELAAFEREFVIK